MGAPSSLASSRHFCSASVIGSPLDVAREGGVEPPTNAHRTTRLLTDRTVTYSLSSAIRRIPRPGDLRVFATLVGVPYHLGHSRTDQPAFLAVS